MAGYSTGEHALCRYPAQLDAHVTFVLRTCVLALQVTRGRQLWLTAWVCAGS
jgi:hypothetical protein